MERQRGRARREEMVSKWTSKQTNKKTVSHTIAFSEPVFSSLKMGTQLPSLGGGRGQTASPLLLLNYVSSLNPELRAPSPLGSAERRWGLSSNGQRRTSDASVHGLSDPRPPRRPLKASVLIGITSRSPL